MTTLSIILAALLGVSEALSLIPALHSNGILDGLINFLKSIGTKSPS